VGAVATVFVFAAWVYAVVYPQSFLPAQSVDAVDALFSGLAFVGVVVAIMLQREELSLQRQELKDTREELRRSAEAQEQHTRELKRQVEDQIKESDENSRARQRQSREQFLTARLNAQLAVFQAKAARFNLKFEGAKDRDGLVSSFRVESALHDLSRSQMRLEILGSEVKQGFAGGAWTPSTEKEAIRNYFVELLLSLVNACDRSEKAGHGPAIGVIASTRKQMALLIEAVGDDHAGIPPAIESVAELFERNASDPKPAIDWCRSAALFFPAGQFPWV